MRLLEWTLWGITLLVSVVSCNTPPAGAEDKAESRSIGQTPARDGFRGLTPVDYTVEKNLPHLLLSRKGIAKVSIAIPDSKVGYYADIAKLLKAYLDKATGADFKIVKQLGSEEKAIFVGPCASPAVATIFAQAQDDKPESFRIHSFSGGIVLAGNDDVGKAGLAVNNRYHSRGTFFAAVDFIERLLGYRFYYPGELGEYTPDYKNTELSIPPFRYRDAPVFSLRSGSQPSYESLDFEYIPTKLEDRKHIYRLWRSGDVGRVKIGHTDCYWHEFFAEDHPEYFALRADGTRMVGKRGPQSSHRCYASEEGLQQHIKAIEAYYQDQRNVRLFARKSLAPNDNYIYWFPNDGFQGCWCEDCQSKTVKLPKNDPFNTKRRERHSRIIFDYAIQLAEEIKKRWPKKKLILPLYATYRRLPEGIVFPDNVLFFPVYFGEFTEAFFKEDHILNNALSDIKKNAAASSGRVFYWSHYPHMPRYRSKLGAPYPIPHILQKLLHDNQERIGGVYLNGEKTFSYALDGFMHYLYYKLLWNPAMDVDACMEEYCDLLFGPAAEEMKAYFRMTTDRWENVKWSEVPMSQYVSNKVDHKHYFEETYPREVRSQLKSLLADGLSKTNEGSLYRRRMIHMCKGLESFFEQGNRFDQIEAKHRDTQKIAPVADRKLGV